MHSPRIQFTASTLALALVLAAGLLAAVPAAARDDRRPTLRLERFRKVVLYVRPLGVKPVRTGRPAELPLAVDPRRGGQLGLELRWPDEASRTRVRLEVEPAPMAAEQTSADLDVSVHLEFGDGSRSRTRRVLAVRESSTALLEVDRRDDRPLILAIRAEFVDEAVLPGTRPVGRSVRLDLEIQRVLDGRVVSLETNQLFTFVGEPVGYSFRLGEDADSVMLSLTPQRLRGDLAEVEVRWSGTLPGEDGLHLGGRTETWITSRDAATAVTFERGDPPTGWRFLITPRF